MLAHIRPSEITTPMLTSHYMTPPRSEDAHVPLHSQMGSVNAQAGPSRPTPSVGCASTGLGGYNPKLDAVSGLGNRDRKSRLMFQMPIEKLQAMIIKNQEDKMVLMEQKDMMTQGEDDWLDEDPEMIVQKM